MIYIRFLIPAAILLLTLQACTEWQIHPSTPIFDSVDCDQLFYRMDSIVDDYGVHDADTARIKDFPELRADRFLASFATDNLRANAYSAWLEHLRKLDASARKIEWRNLPPDAKRLLQTDFGKNIETAIKLCSAILAERDLLVPSRRSQLLNTIEVPDAYSTWHRILGLYFLTRWPVAEGVWRVQREMRQPFIEEQLGDNTATRRIAYAPPQATFLTTHEVAEILTQSSQNLLAIPEPTAQQLKLLFANFAPIWLVDSASENDNIGSVRIGPDDVPYVDTREPITYILASHTRLGHQVLLQLNYIIWFPARPPESLLDIYAGRFDGLIWRVTLKPDGTPLAYDSIHPCGCYYQIFPGRGMRAVQPLDGSEPILSPIPILGPRSGERLIIKIASTTHFIEGIASGYPKPTRRVYRWLDYDDLRSLPAPAATYKSLFDTDGLIPESERPERFLLWPMGVASAGAMRQWGNHAIAFIGRRHFDDPWLFEKLLRPLAQPNNRPK